MTKEIDITNQRFGKLIALSCIGRAGSAYHKQWSCICDCGKPVNVYAHNLRRGITSSCGCLQQERTSNANAKHRLCATKEYKTWQGLRGRCNNKNSLDYPDYGGRGIKVCERWDDFNNFLSDMGNAPKGFSIDRIDVNGNYEPSNCRWADAKTQARNKTNSRFISVDGIVKTMAEWAEISGTSRNNIHKRIMRGWSNEQAVFGKVA